MATMRRGERVVRAEVNDDRRLFAKWLRRVMKQREMPFTELRDALGVPSRRFNRWLKDTYGEGQPEVPTDAECKMIAQLLGVREDFVLRLAARTRAAMDDTVVVVKRPDGEIVRRPLAAGH